MQSISDIFRNIDTQITGEYVSIDHLLEALHERGFGILILLLSVPMALPIPVPPGINVLLASPLILLTAQQALGRHTVWLPEGMRKKTIARQKMSTVIQAILPWSERIERFIKPRLEFVTLGVFSHLIGGFGLIMALTICVPLPLTNTVPSLGIALMAIGVIMRDGVAVLCGAVIGMAWVFVLSMLIMFLGAEGIDMVKEALKNYF